MLMDFAEFSKRYSALKAAGVISCIDSYEDLQELQAICEQSKECLYCSKRSECPLRLSFYMENRWFEYLLQKAEAQDRDLLMTIFHRSVDCVDEDELKTLIEDFVFNKTEDLRRKRMVELEHHPTYIV